MDSHKASRQLEDENIELVKNLQKKLDKGVSFEKTMHILYKLQKIPITIRLLEETKIGYKVRSLSKKEKDNDIGKMAKLLTIAWKKYVRNHRDSDNEHNGSDERDEQPDEEDEEDEEGESCSKKRHHKKKKKKSSKEDLDSDDEAAAAARREKRKEKKRRHRDEEGEQQREHKHKNHNNNGIHSSSSSSSSPSPNKINGTTRKLEPAEDIFGTALAMGDKIKLNNFARRQQQQQHQSSPGSSSLSSVINGSSNISPSWSSNSVPQPPQQQQQPPRLNEPKMLASNYLQQRDREISNYAAAANNSLAYRTIQAQTNHSLAGMKMKGRTAVYAGSSKSVATVDKVYPLVDICLKVLMEHIDRIFEVGDVPFELLRKVLAKCNVHQLERIEYYNPQLKEDSDIFWKDFVEKEFRGRERYEVPEIESWREFYAYLIKEREERLKKITMSINSKQRKAMPERTTQQLLDVRTPREIKRRQERQIMNRGSGGGGGWASASSGRAGTKTISSIGGQVTIINKPKTAPLMKKLIKFRTGKGSIFRR